MPFPLNQTSPEILELRINYVLSIFPTDLQVNNSTEAAGIIEVKIKSVFINI